MDKKKIELVVTIFIIAIFIVAVANAVIAVTKRKQASKNNSAGSSVVSAAVPAPAAPKPTEAVQPQKPRIEEENTEEGPERDPFKRRVGAETQRGVKSAKNSKSNIAGVLLTGIVYDSRGPAKSYCIINGEVVALKGSVAGFVIADIKEDYVILTSEKENKDYRLTVWGEPESIQ